MKVAVVLSGCGYLDGSEISETVMLLWALEKRGCVVDCFAPDISSPAYNHYIGNGKTDESRNALVESARVTAAKSNASRLLFPHWSTGR